MSATDILMAKVLEQDATREEIDQLQEALNASADLRLEWAYLQIVHGHLGPAIESQERTVQQGTRIRKAVEESDQIRFVQGVSRRIRRKKTVRRAAVAAVACIATLLCIPYFPGLTSSAVAVVNQLNGPATLASGDAVQVRKVLRSGSSLSLASGSIRLHFGEAAILVLDGPAKISFENPKHATLHEGRVTVRVSEAGHGFRLDTPDGTVVDLGTAFGVSAMATQPTKVHVFEGEVLVTDPANAQDHPLSAGHALHMKAGQWSQHAVDLSGFDHALATANWTVAAHAHWSFDDATPQGAPLTTHNITPAPSDLTFRVEPNGTGPQSIPGPFGQALRFDGSPAYALADFSAISGDQPRTIACWVRIPHGRPLSYAILSLGMLDHQRTPDGVWQLSANPSPSEGPPGALRVASGKENHVIGSTPLHDGAWHHIAAVLRPDRSVRLYVDGVLEHVEKQRLNRINTTHPPSGGKLLVGKGNNQTSYFQFDIDELSLFPHALEHADILRLMENNTLPRIAPPFNETP